MGRWKDGHKYIKKIVINTKDGSPALIYNLDHKGRLIYEYPVCVGLPANVEYNKPGNYEFTPPPVRVYKKTIKKNDPSIIGKNSITVNIPNNYNKTKNSNLTMDQKNTNYKFDIFNISNSTFHVNNEYFNDLDELSFSNLNQKKSIQKATSLFDLMDDFIASSLQNDESFFSFFENHDVGSISTNQTKESNF